MITVELFHLSSGSSWIIATNGLIIFVGPVLIIKTFGIVYPVIVGVSWVAYPYFEGPVFLFLGVPSLLIVVIFLNMTFVYSFSDPVLGRVVPLLRSGVDNRYVSRDVTNIYYFDFFIGIIFDNISLLSIP